MNVEQTLFMITQEHGWPLTAAYASASDADVRLVLPLLPESLIVRFSLCRINEVCPASVIPGLSGLPVISKGDKKATSTLETS